MHLRRHVILGLALAVGPFMGSARAAGFTYTNTFLLACFRVEGGAADLVVNLGPATAFEALPAGEAVDLPAVDRGQLASAFPILAGVKWSVVGTMRGNTNFPQYPLHTLWTSSPSPSANATGAVWTRQGPFTQGPVGSQIEAIGAGAATYGSQQPAGPNNTATGVVIDAADPNAYGVLMTAAGNLAGTFPGDVENETPADFGAGSESSRSLLYQLVPATGADLRSAGRLLGYFDFRADGTLRFTAGPPPGSITAIRPEAGFTTITFATLPSFSYRLRSADAADVARPVAEWTAESEVIPGDGALHSVRLSPSGSNRFFVLEALP